MICDYESMMGCVLILMLVGWVIESWYCAGSHIWFHHLNIYGMQKIIDQQLEFLRNQSLITSARLEFTDCIIDFILTDDEWVIEPIEREE